MNNLGKAVVVSHPKTGELITRFKTEKGETFGKIRVDQSTLEISGGFSRFANRSAFITVDEKTADLLEPMLADGQPYPIQGKVVVTEALVPFYPGQEPKTKGAGGEVVLAGGKPVYRDTEFTSDLNKCDVLISHDKANSMMNTPQGGNAAE